MSAPVGTAIALREIWREIRAMFIQAHHRNTFQSAVQWKIKDNMLLLGSPHPALAPTLTTGVGGGLDSGMEGGMHFILAGCAIERIAGSKCRKTT